MPRRVLSFNLQLKRTFRVCLFTQALVAIVAVLVTLVRAGVQAKRGQSRLNKCLKCLRRPTSTRRLRTTCLALKRNLHHPTVQTSHNHTTTLHLQYTTIILQCVQYRCQSRTLRREVRPIRVLAFASKAEQTSQVSGKKSYWSMLPYRPFCSKSEWMTNFKYCRS